MTAAEYKEWITPQRASHYGTPEETVFIDGSPMYYAISIAEYKANPFYKTYWDTDAVYPDLWLASFADFEAYQHERFPELKIAKANLSKQKQTKNILYVALLLVAAYWFYKKMIKK